MVENKVVFSFSRLLILWIRLVDVKCKEICKMGSWSADTRLHDAIFYRSNGWSNRDVTFLEDLLQQGTRSLKAPLWGHDHGNLCPPRPAQEACVYKCRKITAQFFLGGSALDHLQKFRPQSSHSMKVNIHRISAAKQPSTNNSVDFLWTTSQRWPFLTVTCFDYIWNRQIVPINGVTCDSFFGLFRSYGAIHPQHLSCFFAPQNGEKEAESLSCI